MTLVGALAWYTLDGAVDLCLHYCPVLPSIVREGLSKVYEA